MRYRVRAALCSIKQSPKSMKSSTILPAILGLVFASSTLLRVNAMFFPKFETVNDIPKDYFVNQTTIYGRVVRVIDGDTIRVRHCRSKWFCPKEEEPTGRRTRIYDSTLSIRIYGVDCPELQKKSSDPPSQPFAQEATDYTTKLILGQVVAMKLLRKDQYGRAVAAVTTKQPFWMLVVRRRKDVSVELAQRGLATLYTGGGAEYNGNRDLLEAKIATAKKNKEGVWSLGNSMISPGDFKKQHGGGKPQHSSAKVY